MKNWNEIKTLGELKKSGYRSRSIKEEVRENLLKNLREGKNSFEGIIGYEDSVIPEVERALLSKHNILFLGLRGQAKTRMARMMTGLLDEYIPAIAGTELNEDPFHPITSVAKKKINELGDACPVEWIPRSQRYGEKLATPDVSVADLIGDIDPIKAANLRLSFSDEEVIHYGIIPRSNRGIFVINELPDLQARIQVALFNILEEGDVQIRGFKIRLPLDILFVFTANPEDYTNRGSIVTPLKDRIQSQILTHYPKSIDAALSITRQEVQIPAEQETKVTVHPLIGKLIEQISFEARNSEFVDKKSGVSARLSISAYQNAVSAAERRAVINHEDSTQIWISDLTGIIPSITGKIELVYEGEQEGPYQVALNLLEKSIRSQFVQHFPDPDSFKRKRQQVGKGEENPYNPIITWFDKGNSISLLFNLTDREKINTLYQVNGLHALVKAYYPKLSEPETALMMEFVLHGLSAYSLLSKKIIGHQMVFKDLMGSMLNFDSSNEYNDDEFDDQ
jgi:magnesium chelatase subunit I